MSRLRLFGLIVRAIIVIVGAHASTFFLIKALPDPKVIALGLYAGTVTLIGDAPRLGRDYGKMLSNLALGQLGDSLDGVPVAVLLANAVAASFPHIALAGLLLFGVSVAIVLWGGGSKLGSNSWLLLNVLPPYVPAMLLVILALLLHLPLANPIIAGLATSLPAIAIVASVLYPAIDGELKSEHSLFYRAQGASNSELRVRISKNVGILLLPTLHVVVISLFTAQIFVESLAGIGGLGSLTVRAAQRVDQNLLLGIVLLYAVMVAGVDTAARVIRSRFPT